MPKLSKQEQCCDQQTPLIEPGIDSRSASELVAEPLTINFFSLFNFLWHKNECEMSIVKISLLTELSVNEIIF